MSPGSFILFLVTALVCLSSAYGQNDEIRLIESLLEKYPKGGGRPVANFTDSIEVKLKMHLLHVEKVDTFAKVFSIVAWLSQQWTDTLLQWDPSEFGGVDYVLMDLSSIWRPDITLFNALDKPQLLQPVMAHVSSTGDIIIVEAFKFVSQCPDVKKDQKNPSCTLKFGSWSYDVSRLSTSGSEEKVDISHFQTSNVYELLGSKVKAEEKTYPCCPGTKYGHVGFTIELEERKQEPEVDPNASSAPISFAKAGTVAALVALQLALLSLS